MPKILIKPRIFPKENKIEIKLEVNTDNSSILPPNLQSFEQKLLSGSGFVEYK